MLTDNMEDQDAQMLLVLLAAFKPTRTCKNPNTQRRSHLDVIITPTEDRLFQITNTRDGQYISDHRLIILETMETKPKTKIEGQKIRKINENTIHKFCDNFNNNPVIQATTLKKAVIHLSQEMLRNLNLAAPTKEMKVKKKKLTSWNNEELKQQRKILRNRECKWFKYREDYHWLTYKHEKNRYSNMLKFKKLKDYTN